MFAATLGTADGGDSKFNHYRLQVWLLAAYAARQRIIGQFGGTGRNGHWTRRR
jgi:hypothetical protein